MTDWKEKLEKEFELAESARARGNDGQARVCARRAAGIAIREYFERRGYHVRTPSAYDLLQMIMNEPQLSPELKQSAGYLILRVNKEFNLPVDVDLLDEARKLCDGLISN